MRILPWVRMPSRWIREGGLKNFNWASNGVASKSAAIAALQIYIALVTQAEEKSSPSFRLEAELTYNALMEITGLSRALVSSGIEALLNTERISKETIGRKSRYSISDYEVGNWCKLPARALYGYGGGTSIPAFKLFQKRTICELNALKLMLYYAAARDNKTPYTMASFETIHKQTGVIEKNIPRANAFLINSSLLANLTRENSESTKKKEPNKYYLTGYRDLFVGSPIARVQI
ncbi:helix-turn-helix domain-containing protein [Pseudomonas sp. NFPP19]|uniref:helix-turn-helix domain-containing protein n=1 Tax=Pseudomonas sp. NFPP19 TaxID=1566225 RepID=UPI0008BD3127|nr:helix-turn-helix domain-containing protein [Pseudomonas sp. NFPP19]SEP90821.1 hypothetical protein SAMN03159354_00735 [Pseudomonas sp. NFPP19]